MHILHQSRFVIGQPQRLAIITLLLTLPAEGSTTTDEEAFFKMLGMETVPDVSAPITGLVDLSVFSGKFANAAIMPCTDTQRWFVATEYAHVSGAVVSALQKNFQDVPFDFGEIEDISQVTQVLGGGNVEEQPLNSLDWEADSGAWVPQTVVLSPRQLAIAYATGDWQNVFEEPTPAPTPAPTLEPVFMTIMVDRIDYDQMTSSESLVGPFQTAIRKDVAEWANLSASLVQLNLVKDSTFLTRVQVTVYPGAEAVTAEDGVLTELGEKIHKDILSITTLNPITQGEITVEGPTVSRWVDPSTVESVTAPPDTA
jgi:hypothetical protein